MRIIRRDDEKVIAASTNNSSYNQKDDSNFEYDICSDYTFSDKRFMNELAKDRLYGTANIRPAGRNKGRIKERLYQDAIEESSRIKTGGYYNQVFEEQREYNIHDTIPGRLKSRADEEKVCQINDGLAFNVASVFREEKAKTVEPLADVEDTNFMNQMPAIPAVEYNNINMDYSMPVQLSEENAVESPYSKNHKKDIYEDIMNKVSDDLVKNSGQNNGGSTRCVAPDRSDIKCSGVEKVNNIPYKKTEIFEKGSGKGNKKKDSNLVVRDCKKERQYGTDASNDQIGVGAWLCSILFMIIPVIGFIVSGIVSLVVPKDKAYKCFARICLTTHMLVSIAAFYLYMTDKLNLEIIQNYITRF